MAVTTATRTPNSNIQTKNPITKEEDSKASSLKIISLGIKRFYLFLYNSIPSGEDPIGAYGIYPLGARRPHEVLDNYAQAAKGRPPQKKLSVLKNAFIYAKREVTDYWGFPGEPAILKNEAVTLFNDVLQLSIELKDSDPKLARKALESLVNERVAPGTLNDLDPLSHVPADQIQLAKRTLAEVYENLGDKAKYRKASLYEKADKCYPDPEGETRRAAKLNEFISNDINRIANLYVRFID